MGALGFSLEETTQPICIHSLKLEITKQLEDGIHFRVATIILDDVPTNVTYVDILRDWKHEANLPNVKNNSCVMIMWG